MKKEYDMLWKAAMAAREHAYAPYSKFPVGSSVETEDGKIFAGCNVENASYGLTICAERSAIFQAISAGEKNIRRVMIIADYEGPCPPCGACRQVIREFNSDAEVIMANIHGQMTVVRMSVLLPASFTFTKKQGSQG